METLDYISRESRCFQTRPQALRDILGVAELRMIPANVHEEEHHGEAEAARGSTSQGIRRLTNPYMILRLSAAEPALS
jgi:hypothetical protein